MSFTIHLTWRGRTATVFVPVSDPTLEVLGLEIERELGTSFETLKLLVAGRKGQVAPAKQREQSASQAGLTDGCRALLLASSAEDVSQVRTAHDLPLMRGFEDELKRAARRRRTARTDAAVVQPPRAEFTFQAYESWQHPGLHPPPSEALKLLYRLASDPGILGVMAAHGYRVGLLSEMPPEGKVGISPQCILGVNINAGQEISLRLRTDDLKGFRKYERIRETLIHELTHMEYGDHDNNFKRLNSELGRECAAINARYAGGLTLMGDGGAARGSGRVAAWAAADDSARVSELDDPALLLDEAGAVMAATARFSGKTLRQLTAIGGDGGVFGAAVAGAAADVTAAAAAADVSPAPLQTAKEGDGAGGNSNSSSSRSASDDSDGGGEAAAGRRFEHFDEATERAEDAARRLGAFDDPAQVTQNGQAVSATQPLAKAGTAPYGAEPSGAPSPAAAAPAPAAAVAAAVAVTDTAAAPAPAAGTAAGTAEATAGKCAVGVASNAPPQHSDPMAIDSVPGATPGGMLITAAPPAQDHQQQHQNEHQQQEHQQQEQQQAAALNGKGEPQNHRPPPPPPPAPAVTALPPAPVQLSLQPPETSGGDGAAGAAAEAAQAKLRQAWNALAQMATASKTARHQATAAAAAAAAATAADGISAADVAAALDTLETMLGNAVHFPTEDRYRRVRLGNGAFQRRVGRLPGGVELLRVAGFVEEKDASAAAAAGAGAVPGVSGEAVLRLRRNDPGLLWLVLAAVREAKEQVAAQLAGASVSPAGPVSQG